MTQTTTIAETAVRIMAAGTDAEVVKIEADGTMGEADLDILMLRVNAEALMRELAAKLGYVVLSPAQREELTNDVALTVQRASERQNTYLGTVADGYLNLNHASDDVRDLRTELRAAGVIAS